LKKQKPKTYRADIRVDMSIRLWFDAANPHKAQKLLYLIVKRHLRVPGEVWLNKKDAKLITGPKRPKAGKIGVYSEEEIHSLDVAYIERDEQ